MSAPKVVSAAELRASLTTAYAEASTAIEESGHVPRELVRLTADQGALRLTAPATSGGLALSVVEALPLIEAAAAVHPAARMLVHVSNGIWRPLSVFGSNSQRALVQEIGRGE